MRVDISLNLGRDTATGGQLIVSQDDFLERPNLVAELNELVFAVDGQVDLDGHVSIVSGSHSFLGADYWIADLEISLVLLEKPLCSGGVEEMFLNGGQLDLTASRAADMVRFEVRSRRSRELVDSAEFKAANIAGEWFLAWARFCRIAAELGDEYSIDRVRTVFRGLCPEYRGLVGEERLASVLNDPFEQAMQNHYDSST